MEHQRILRQINQSVTKVHMKRTPLFEIHSAATANIINLKGFARPVEYVGHAAEHRAIRERVSLCDVSHMGEFLRQSLERQVGVGRRIVKVSGWNVEAIGDAAWPTIVRSSRSKVLFFAKGIK